MKALHLRRIAVQLWLVWMHILIILDFGRWSEELKWCRCSVFMSERRIKIVLTAVKQFFNLCRFAQPQCKTVFEYFHCMTNVFQSLIYVIIPFSVCCVLDKLSCNNVILPRVTGTSASQPTARSQRCLVRNDRILYKQLKVEAVLHW